MKKIFGEKLYLRPMILQDSELVVSWRNNPDILKWMFNNETLSLESHIKWFKSKKNRLDYIIVDKLNGDLIGLLNYKILNHDVAEAGKLIGNEKYLGRGYAKEAFKIWIDFGFDILKLKKIIIKTRSNNLPNIALNKKLGFKKSNHTLKKDISLIEMILYRDEKQ